MDPKKLEAALKVMVLDARIRVFLVENDPQALKQALDALDAPKFDPKKMKPAHGGLAAEVEARVEAFAEACRRESLAERV